MDTLSKALNLGRRKLADLEPTPSVDQRWLLVDVTGQQIVLLQGEEVVLVKPVSTASAGLNCRQDSGGTPGGLHRIARKIGQDAKKGTVFVGRKPIGKTWRPGDDETVADDLILTRILTLDGLEDGLNRGKGHDSKARYIYIHGTNHEDLIGSPVSHGCVRMTSDDIMELFELVTDGDPVVIL